MPDHDSGSLRMVNLMRVLRELGLAVSFLPDNRAYDGNYTQALQALGVEALYHPFVADPIAWLRERGRTLDLIVLSRHYVAASYVGLARLYAPQAKLAFDTVDLHYLREQRAAELTGKADLARHAARTRAQELKLMRECDVTLVVSRVETGTARARCAGRTRRGAFQCARSVRPPPRIRCAPRPGLRRRLPASAEHRRGFLVRARGVPADAREPARRALST